MTDRATVAYNKIGQKLLSFEVGNEPDTYPMNIPGYVEKWGNFVQAIGASLPSGAVVKYQTIVAAALKDGSWGPQHVTKLIFDKLGTNRSSLQDSNAMHMYIFALDQVSDFYSHNRTRRLMQRFIDGIQYLDTNYPHVKLNLAEVKCQIAIPFFQLFI